MQTIVLHGKITKDLELQYTKSGAALLKFSLAVSESEKVDGQWKQVTEWFDCVAWNKKAETIHMYVKPQDYLEVSVKRKTNTQEKDGKKIRYYDYVVKDFEFGGSANFKGKATAVSKPSPFSEIAKEVEKEFKVEADDTFTTDDIPF